MTKGILKEELILKIEANPADKEIFELYFCSDCRQFVAAWGLFPPLSLQPAHSEHLLIALPGLDSNLPLYPVEGHILHWLESFRNRLDYRRYAELKNYAATCGSSNWVWVLRGVEQTSWLNYLDIYLNRLADDWLDALNGKASFSFPDPSKIWFDGQGRNAHPPELQFNWESASPILNEALLLTGAVKRA
ncbi:MAG TPA: hypothetical protein VH186_26655 [Chloroflexia bacterium]|nr:hypothetical protein [Chloroflexia bacterium]